MTVTLKLFASLSRFLPAEKQANQVQIEVPQGTSALEILDRYKVPAGQVHLVLVNGVFLPPGEREQALAPGDELAVWPPVAGG